jgi:hypothetical protein
MGKNWIHLREGAGSDADATNDVLVSTSTTSQVKAGDGATVKCFIRTDKHLGAGQVYKLHVEEARVRA